MTARGGSERPMYALRSRWPASRQSEVHAVSYKSETNTYTVNDARRSLAPPTQQTTPSEHVEIARVTGGQAPVALPDDGGMAWLRTTDKLALASAACAFTALIPVASQVAGIVLGVASLLRIRRAGRRGEHVSGVGWAWAGILISGFVLLSWVAVAAVLIGTQMWLADSLDRVKDLVPPGPT